MNLLRKVNRIYGRYLYLVVPFMTILFGALQLIFYRNHQLTLIAVLVLCVTSVMFTFLYIKEKKQNVIYPLIQINNIYYLSFMFCASRVKMNDILGFLFVTFGVFFLFFILYLNTKTKKI